MKTCIVLAAFLALAASSAVRTQRPDKMPADKTYLMKEKSLLQLLVHINQPLLDSRLSQIAQHFQEKELESTLNSYQFAPEEVLEKLHMIKRGEVFNQMDEGHQKSAKSLYNMLNMAKDWDTFYKTAVWAREYINEGMFLFALHSVIRVRPDTMHLQMPPLYEIIPHKFVRTEFLHKAMKERLRGQGDPEKDIVIIPSNTSEWYHHKMHPEMRMMYFTEDAMLNEWNHDINMEWPMLREGIGKNISNQNNFGERIYFRQKQLLARYRLERLPNNLEDLKMFMWDNQKMVSFVPHLRYENGEEMPMRSEMEPIDTEDMPIKNVKIIEERIRDAVERNGAMVENEFTKFEEKTVEVISRFINMDTFMYWPDLSMPDYYYSLMRKMLTTVSHMVDPKSAHKLAPSALMNYETQLRDPLYYQILLRIHELYRIQKASLGPYTKPELRFSDFQIEKLEFDKLVTFFEAYDININNAIDVTALEHDKKMMMYARHSHIQHKAFNYRAIISSKKSENAVVRLFIGPQLDLHGLEMTLAEKAPLMVEIDHFVVNLAAGKNKIERNSMDFTMFKEEKPDFRTLYKQVEEAIQGKATVFYRQDEYLARLPAHLLLPKGKKTGMPYTMFMMVTPFKAPANNTDDWTIVDMIPLGYPFDREMDYSQWLDLADMKLHPNMKEQEVIIYHKKTDEVHDSI